VLRERLVCLAKDARLEIKENKHESGHVFYHTIMRTSGGFFCIQDDGSIHRDSLTDLLIPISALAAARYLGFVAKKH
jgi:hypothetical protein